MTAKPDRQELRGRNRHPCGIVLHAIQGVSIFGNPRGSGGAPTTFLGDVILVVVVLFGVVLVDVVVFLLGVSTLHNAIVTTTTGAYHTPIANFRLPATR